jgi:hypothetical protein
MIEIKIAYTGNASAVALNRPDWAEFNLTMMKVASIDKAKADVDLGGFDLEAALKDHPEHLFVKVFAIKKDEPNDNGDAFCEEELKKAAPTFVNVPVFTNHQNDDVAKAKGKVVHAWYDYKKGGIYIISMIDKLAYPQIARGVEEGYISGTSMGAQVQYSVCNICHNKAHTADEYCSCVKGGKNKKVSKTLKCSYHDSKCEPDSDEPCPLCKCKKADRKELVHKNAQVYEHNYGIKFIEDSLVVNPACHSCVVECVLNVPEITNKFSSFKRKLRDHVVQKSRSAAARLAAAEAEMNSLCKVASVMDVSLVEESATLLKQSLRGLVGVLKTGGKIELEKINEAMGLLEIVARSMMDQKQQVSLEYVSDIVDILASAQEVADELEEMGYGNVPSPATINEYVQTAGGPPAAAYQQQPQQPQMPEMAPPSGGGVQDSNLATITTPQSKTSSGTKKEDLVTAGVNMKEKIEALYHKLALALAERDAERSVGTTDNSTTKESQVTMANTPQDKVAAGPGQTELSQQVITEKVLEDKKNASEMLHPRTETHPEGITQSDTQLGGKAALHDVTTATPQVRLDNSPNFITEAQFQQITDGYHFVRWNEYPEVITEKQWEEMHRAVGSVLSNSQEDRITQSQLRDLLSHHTWTEPAPNFTTEKQLAEGGFGGDGKGVGNLDRLNSSGVVKGASFDAKKLVQAAKGVIVDAVVNYNKTPGEVAKAAQYLTRTPQSTIKAAYLLLVNGLPAKLAAREDDIRRNAYFAKVASSSSAFVEAHDALIACMSGHCRNLKAEDLVEAVAFAATNTTVMASVDEAVRTKMASRNSTEETPVLDKFAALRSAAVELDRPEDGLYQIMATIREVGINPENKAAFVRGVEKFASQYTNGVETAAVDIKVNRKAGTVVAVVKEVEKMSKTELTRLAARKAAIKTATSAKTTDLSKRAAARKSLVKQAQFGGGMPDQMGAAPGGAAGPMPAAPGGPGAGAPPPVENLGGDGAPEDMADTSDAQPKPPGSTCPVCTSEDVDIVEGRGKCKNCTAEFTYKINIEVTKWPETLDKGEEAVGDDEMGEGEGFEMPGEANPGAMPPAGGAGPNAQPNIPVAAMARISPAIVTKLAAIKDRIMKAAGNEAEMQKLALRVHKGGFGIPVARQIEIAASPESFMIGRISPATGSTNTVKVASNTFLCLDSGTPYVVETAFDQKDVNRPFVQWKWLAKVAGRECASCSRSKQAFVKALKSINMSERQFDSLDIVQRGKAILKMESAGAFKQVKTASKTVNASTEFKLAFAIPTDKFPMESCREKLARRFGEDAVALSGPCEGQNLADCTCKSLKRAGVYADYLATKVAGVWALMDAREHCVTDFVKKYAFTLRQAETCCTALKAKYAQSHEHFLDEMANDAGGDDMGGDMPHGGGGDDFGGGGDDDTDPFDGGDDMGAGAPPADDAGKAAPGDDMGGDVGGMGGDEVEIPLDDAGNGDLSPGSVTGEEPVGAPMAEVTPGGNVVVNQEVLNALEVLDKALDTAKGGSPAAEPHHQGDLPSSAEIPLGDVEGLDDAASPVLEDAIEQGGDVGGDVPGDTSGTAEEITVDDMGGDDLGGEAPSHEEGGDVPVEEHAGDDLKKVEEPVADDTSFSADEGDGLGNKGDDVDNVSKDREAFAKTMQKGVIGRTGQIRMDLTSVIAAVNKARTKLANDGKELKVMPAQEAVEGKIQNGGTLGNEEKFKAEKPDVKSDESGSLMGNEQKIEAVTPTVPTGDQRLGHEEAHLKPEHGDKVTGGVGGAGGDMADKTVASTKDMTYRLAQRLLAARQKIAGEKTVDNRKPTQETEGIGQIRDGKTHPHADDEKPFEAAEPENLSSKEGDSWLGHEKESIDPSGRGVPRPVSEFAPTIPTEKGEKVDEIRGTTVGVTAGAKSQQYKEAMRVAGRMVAEGMINPGQLMQTVDELRELKPSLLKAYEVKMFSTSRAPKVAKAQKGLDVVQDGSEQPVVNYERDTKKANLSQRIAGLFTLSKQVEAANDRTVSDADFRKTHRR